MADVPNQFGGRVTITAAGVRDQPTEADITLELANISREAKANQDGSACFTAKPKLYKADIKFRNSSDIDWNTVLRQNAVNVTIDEEDNARSHLFTAAGFTGDPKYNVSDGSVDGVTIESAQYQLVTG
jgi:hypothetical protein